MSNPHSSGDAIEMLEALIADEPKLQVMVAEEYTNGIVGERLYALRNAHGLTQKQLAKLAGTTQSVIARIEDADYYGHTLTLLSRVAHALGYTIEVNFIKKKPRSQRAIASSAPPKRRIAARSIAKSKSKPKSTTPTKKQPAPSKRKP